MSEYTLYIKEGVARNPLVRLAAPITASVAAGEHIAVVGRNGAGKSLFVDTLIGKYPLREGTQSVCSDIRYIAFRDSYGAADANYYYQQRWNVGEQEESPTVGELLGGAIGETKNNVLTGNVIGEARSEATSEALKQELFEMFGMKPLLDKKLIFLSSGELRKFQLIKVLLTAPRVLVMDNPFIGLDASARELLSLLLERIAQTSSVQIILVLSMLDDIPSFITHVIPVSRMRVLPKVERDAYLTAFRATDTPADFGELQQRILALPNSNLASFNIPEANDEVVGLHRVSIRYGNRTIVHERDWTVRCGEKWALSGKNGSGKSTLLSLVCADNPQSYACDIRLFGRKRGTGESIWEIKKHIGYVSPEMHRAYLKNLPAIEIVASGLHDSIGLYLRPKPEQMAVCEWWMDIFGIAALKDRPFLQLSGGEQRLALLARAFVKDPELLILDEPLHGLDTYNRRRVKKIIEAFCRRPHKTMIMVTHYEAELPATITHRLTLQRQS